MTEWYLNSGNIMLPVSKNYRMNWNILDNETLKIAFASSKSSSSSWVACVCSNLCGRTRKIFPLKKSNGAISAQKFLFHEKKNEKNHVLNFLNVNSSHILKAFNNIEHHRWDKLKYMMKLMIIIDQTRRFLRRNFITVFVII